MEKKFKNEVIYDFQSYHTPMTKSMYLGVFLGFITAIVCLAFWSFAVNILQLTMSSYVVNVQTIAFGTIIPLVVFGILYAALTHYLKSAGAILASVIFALADLWLILVIAKGDYGDTAQHIYQFKELLIPIIAIIGIVGAVVFPICYKSQKVADAVL
ncbi:hypothetical protein A9P82_07870 [Arachidicoccus ginsenosidimutans]|uniref:hypothetical protein n=1 Tax=Arachidicoccus sp. BS20 TaxID=1850526 RepID=UPI0007F082FC|nr:hypothetical protein [Arachidicoccus sp. BS20]ANI89215.1 hypothetical protein A9P82_07870 [Arachidicoccus sp. BS20]